MYSYHICVSYTIVYHATIKYCILYVVIYQRIIYLKYEGYGASFANPEVPYTLNQRD